MPRYHGIREPSEGNVRITGRVVGRPTDGWYRDGVGRVRFGRAQRAAVVMLGANLGATATRRPKKWRNLSMMDVRRGASSGTTFWR